MKSICKYNQPLKNIIEKINEPPYGIAFLVDESEKLCGVMTDGDARRFILKGKNLESRLEKSEIGDFVFGRKGDSFDALFKKTSERIRIIPIVNDDFEPVDFFQYSHKSNVTPVAEPDLKGNELKYVTDAVLSTWISSKGEYINRFEKDFSKFCQCRYGAATSNGTVALHLALLALGIGEGDEVIVPDFTFAATINAVLHANATPVIVDIEPQSWCIDPVEIEKAISPKTKAIIPVHIYGQPCDMDAIMQIARKHNLCIIEDCAEAHGAEYDGKKVGSFGDIGCFSFFGNKVITSGEGGMCVTNSEELDSEMRIIRDHGMSPKKKYWHDRVGYNYRMTNLQAAIACAQLERIDSILRERAEIERTYTEIFSKFDSFEMQRNDLTKRKKITWLVALLTKGLDRDKFIEEMNSGKIDTRPFFYPLSEMPIYWNYVFSNKNSVKLSKRGVLMPTHDNVDFDNVKIAITNML